MDFNLNEADIYSLMSLPRGLNNTDYFNNSCNRPHKVMSVDSYCNVLLCSCSGWLPLPIGNILDFSRLTEVWDNTRARYLQQDVDDKKYTFCAINNCGIKHHNIEEQRYQIILGIDDSCNLVCPSCRRDPIMHTSGPEFDKKKAAVDHIVKMLENFEHPVHISLSGVGDPLASYIYRGFIKNYNPTPTQTFTLTTNGLLIKKQLSDSKLLSAITQVSISVDAASKEVYEDVRRPGKWEILLENLDFLQDKGKIVILNFCVQNKNYKEIPAFVDLCQKYKFNANIHQLDDWGTWNKSKIEMPDKWTIVNGDFLEQDVLNPSHPNFKNCMDICKDIVKQKLPRVKFSPPILSLMQ